MVANSSRVNFTSAGPRRATAMTSSTFFSRMSQRATSTITFPTPMRATRRPMSKDQVLYGGSLL